MTLRIKTSPLLFSILERAANGDHVKGLTRMVDATDGWVPRAPLSEVRRVREEGLDIRNRAETTWYEVRVHEEDVARVRWNASLAHHALGVKDTYRADYGWRFTCAGYLGPGLPPWLRARTGIRFICSDPSPEPQSMASSALA